MAVIVSELTKIYEDIKALDCISINFPSNSISAVLGPSGSGKTTLLRCIAGVETPDSGEITIDGNNVFSSKRNIEMPPEKRNVGMVFQSYALWPHMTVYDNVAYPLKVRNQSVQLIEESVSRLLKLLSIWDLKERYPAMLSGGQQQRVALARALVYQPSLVLLDEPLSNLDEPLRKEIAGEIRHLQRSLRFTAVYVTHNREEALWLADELFIIMQGRLLDWGEPVTLLQKPKSSFTANFLCDMKILSGKVISDEGGYLLVETAIGRLTCKGKANSSQVVCIAIDQNRVAVSNNEIKENCFKPKLVERLGLRRDGLYEYLVKIEDLNFTIPLDRERINERDDLFIYIPPESCLLVDCS